MSENLKAQTFNLSMRIKGLGEREKKEVEFLNTVW